MFSDALTKRPTVFLNIAWKFRMHVFLRKGQRVINVEPKMRYEFQKLFYQHIFTKYFARVSPHSSEQIAVICKIFLHRKLICLHLPTDCFMKISLQSTGHCL